MFKDAGLDLIKISLDSPVKDEHDKSRGIEGLFDIIMKAVDMIIEEGLLCELSTVTTREILDSGKIWQLVELAEKKGVILGLVIPALCGGWSQKEEVLLTDKHRKVLEKLVKLPHVVRDTQTGLFCNQCSAGKEQIYVTAYGDVLPCSVVHISFGNVRDTPLKDIWSKIRGSGVFDKEQKVCLAGEDVEFMDKYLKPINQKDKMPVSFDDCKNNSCCK